AMRGAIPLVNGYPMGIDAPAPRKRTVRGRFAFIRRNRISYPLIVVLACLAPLSAWAGEPAVAAKGPSGPCDARVVQLAAAKSHACALLADGPVRCWGSNYRGQLGDGTTTFRSAPVAVTGLRDVAFIAAGERHTCAARRDGSVSCWGSNDHGQLGRAVQGPLA